MARVIAAAQAVILVVHFHVRLFGVRVAPAVVAAGLRVLRHVRLVRDVRAFRQSQLAQVRAASHVTTNARDTPIRSVHRRM